MARRATIAPHAHILHCGGEKGKEGKGGKRPASLRLYAFVLGPFNAETQRRRGPNKANRHGRWQDTKPILPQGIHAV